MGRFALLVFALSCLYIFLISQSYNYTFGIFVCQPDSRVLPSWPWPLALTSSLKHIMFCDPLLPFPAQQVHEAVLTLIT